MFPATKLLKSLDNYLRRLRIKYILLIYTYTKKYIFRHASIANLVALHGLLARLVFSSAIIVLEFIEVWAYRFHSFARGN